MARDLFGERLGEGAFGIEPGADRGAALRQRVKLLQPILTRAMPEATCAA